LVRLLLGFGIQAQHLRFLLDVHRNGSTLTQGREQGARVHAEGQEGMEVVDKLSLELPSTYCFSSLLQAFKYNINNKAEWTPNRLQLPFKYYTVYVS